MCYSKSKNISFEVNSDPSGTLFELFFGVKRFRKFARFNFFVERLISLMIKYYNLCRRLRNKLDVPLYGLAMTYR